MIIIELNCIAIGARIDVGATEEVKRFAQYKPGKAMGENVAAILGFARRQQHPITWSICPAGHGGGALKGCVAALEKNRCYLITSKRALNSGSLLAGRVIGVKDMMLAAACPLCRAVSSSM